MCTGAFQDGDGLTLQPHPPLVHCAAQQPQPQQLQQAPPLPVRTGCVTETAVVRDLSLLLQDEDEDEGECVLGVSQKQLWCGA